MITALSNSETAAPDKPRFIAPVSIHAETPCLRHRWREHLTGMAQKLNLASLQVCRLVALDPADTQVPADPAPLALVVSRDFERRWRAQHGDRQAGLLSGKTASSKTAIGSLVSDQASSGSLAARIDVTLAKSGEVIIGLDTSGGFLALHVKTNKAPRQENHCPETSKGRELALLAAEMTRVAEQIEAATDAAQDVMMRLLEGNAAAALVIDADGRIRTGNGIARDVFGADPIDQSHPALSAMETASAEDQQLIVTTQGRRLVAYRMAWPQDDAPFCNGDEIWVAWQAGRGAGTETAADTASMIVDDCARKSNVAAALRRTFRLTPKESELAVCLMNASLREAAADCKMAYETARSHLKSIFFRTRTNKQTELSNLLQQFVYHERIRRTFSGSVQNPAVGGKER